ncbi:hypothetical protein EON80_27685 [bacterium]|nr:MAG: hypothetical protein EON80_27685 [bacterium]
MKGGAIIGLSFVVIYALGPGRPKFSPLLRVNETSLTINNQEIDWSRVSTVEVSHLLNLEGAFDSIQLIFRESNREEIGRAILPKEQCSVGAEVSLLKYIGQLLGRRIKTIAPDQPYWI